MSDRYNPYGRGPGLGSDNPPHDPRLPSRPPPAVTQPPRDPYPYSGPSYSPPAPAPYGQAHANGYGNGPEPPVNRDYDPNGYGAAPRGRAPLPPQETFAPQRYGAGPPDARGREASPTRGSRANFNTRARGHTQFDRDGRSVETRLQLERPCRTLFVRNISVSDLLYARSLCQYEADTERLRTQFEAFGQIKTYFDIVRNRGMLFITYVSAIARFAGRCLCPVRFACG